MTTLPRKIRDMVSAVVYGNKMPYVAMKVSERTGLPFYVLCAFLEQETGGGKNIFGHDPTIFVGAGKVTKKKYLNYKKQRDADKAHRKMQGVGPLQLCVSPETKVLTKDLLWLRADEVKAGDEIIAFDEFGMPSENHNKKTLRRHFRTAVVEDMFVSEMPRMKITTDDDNSITVTPNHKFLTWRPERYTWKMASELSVGDKLISIPTWESIETYETGWLAGEMDGEGCLTVGEINGKAYGRLFWSQHNDSPDVPYFQSLLDKYGFRYKWHNNKARGGWAGQKPGHGKIVAAVAIGSTWIESLKFIGSVRPRRMLRHPRLSEVWEHRQLNMCNKPVVSKIEILDDGDMVAHQTSTRTMITNGYLTHNTYYTYQDEADKRGGCWNAEISTTVGAELIKSYWDKYHDWHKVGKAFNGSDAYATQIAARINKWKTFIRG